MNAFPKPDRYDRPQKQIDTRGLKFAKKHPDRSAGYRRYVVRFDCALKGEAFGPCDWRRNEAAHLDKTGLSIKGHDSSCAPLCAGPNGHHRRLDRNELPAEARAVIVAKATEIRAEWEKKQEARTTR